MRAGGFAGGFFAIFVPSGGRAGARRRRHDGTPALRRAAAAQSCKPRRGAERHGPHGLAPACASSVRREGEVEVCRTAAQIRRCLDRGALATVMHIEGAEAIDPDLRMLDVLYEAGLRSLGPVWSRVEHLRPRRAVPLSLEPGYGPGPDGPRPRPRAGLQPPRHHDRPVAPQREGLLGRRAALERSARRDPFERARDLPAFAQS